MHAPPTKAGRLIQVVHAFDNHKSALSEGNPLAVVLGDFPKRHIRRGTTRISRSRYGKAQRGCASRVPRLARRVVAPPGRDHCGLYLSVM